MQSRQEEMAGRLITCAEWIVSGRLTLELARKFRTLNSSHIFEKLVDSDRETIFKAAKLIQEKYGDRASVVDFCAEERKAV